MIQPILNYQTKEKEKLVLVYGVEHGKAKRELDEANRIIAGARNTLLALENDAQTLRHTYESISKNLNECFDKITAFNRTLAANPTEEETTAALTFLSGIQSRVGAYEAQISEVSKKITEKSARFEDAKNMTGRAQKTVQLASVEYEKQKTAIAPAVEKINKELTELGKSVNPALLEKYKSIRRGINPQAGRGEIPDVVVALAGNRCGGCHFELPLSLIHSITTNGYIICEECGKIIYK